MKKICLLFTLLSFSYLSSAQIFNLGVKAGINLQNIDVSNFDANQTYESIESGEQKSGFHAGLYTQFNLPILHIRPEFVYTYVNNTMTLQSLGESRILDLRFNRFDVPLLVGKSFGPVRLNVGPIMSFTISEPSDAFEQGINDATWGYQAGLGLDIGKISLDVRYEGAFNNITNSITIDGQDFNLDARGRQVVISLGIKLL